MGSGYGMLSHMGVQFQNSFGTFLTTSQHYIAITNESLNFGVEQLEEPGMYGRIAQNPMHAGFQRVEGSVTMMANPIEIGWFLKCAIGLTSTTSDVGIQTHVFRARSADKDDWSATDLLTFEANRDVGSAALYYDCAGNNLSLGINNGELMTCELGVIGAGFQKQEKSTPLFDDSTPFKWDQVSASYNGAAIEDITELSINYVNNLEARYTMANTRAPTRIKRTAAPRIEVSGTILFTQHSYWYAFEQQSELPLVLNFVGQQSPNVLRLDIPRLRFSEFNVNVAGQGLIEASFTGYGIYDQTSGYDFEVTLINTQTYY